MAVNPMLGAGVNGINSGLNGLKRAAQDVAELNLDQDGPDSGTATPEATTSRDVDDSVSAVTDLAVYERQVQASAKVIESADSAVGFLLDVHA